MLVNYYIIYLIYLSFNNVKSLLQGPRHMHIELQEH